MGKLFRRVFIAVLPILVKEQRSKKDTKYRVEQSFYKKPLKE